MRRKINVFTVKSNVHHAIHNSAALESKMKYTQKYAWNSDTEHSALLPHGFP